MGEHWDASRGEPYADHSFDALRRSLDASVARLGRIDILQLHKTSPAVLATNPWRAPGNMRARWASRAWAPA